MQLIIAAVGQRQPAWADAAYEDFAKRFPPEMRLALKAVKAEPRGSKTAEQLMAAEAQRLLRAHIEQSKLEVRHITLDMLYRARQAG